MVSGNGGEEFWHTIVLSEYESNVPGSAGAGPSRIVEVHVDNRLAGWVLPFRIIYTGGRNPDFWGSMVGINAFDIPRYQIDILPFLPTLWDKRTTVKLRMFNGYNNGIVNQNWWLDANVLTWETSEVDFKGAILSLGYDNGDPVANGNNDGESYQ